MDNDLKRPDARERRGEANGHMYSGWTTDATVTHLLRGTRIAAILEHWNCPVKNAHHGGLGGSKHTTIIFSVTNTVPYPGNAATATRARMRFPGAQAQRTTRGTRSGEREATSRCGNPKTDSTATDLACRYTFDAYANATTTQEAVMLCAQQQQQPLPLPSALSFLIESG